MPDEGLAALSVRAAKIRRDEQDGTVKSASFLTECRERARALLQTHG